MLVVCVIALDILFRFRKQSLVQNNTTQKTNKTIALSKPQKQIRIPRIEYKHIDTTGTCGTYTDPDQI